MKITKSLSEIMAFNNIAAQYLAKNPQENKLTASIRNFLKQVQKVFDEYNEQREAIRLENSAVNPIDQTILREPSTTNPMGQVVAGDYKFDKAGLKKCNEEIKALLTATHEYDTRISKDIEPLIATLTESEKEYFGGLIIPVQLVLEEQE